MTLTAAQPSTATRVETVAVVIPTLNVGPIIRRCLDSVVWADEIIIVDMFSTDDTLEICREYPNVRIFQRQDYIFANVNYGMEQARSDWVVRLDSDEIPDPNLQESIQAVLRRPDPALSGYYFNSVQYMFGRPMKYGPGLPELNARKCMFRKGTAAYPCQAEHEDIRATGELGTLAGHYTHYTNHTVEEVISKFNYYTSKDVERMNVAELTPDPAWKVLYHAVRRFILYYVQYKGYRDGYLGLFSSLFRGPVYLMIEHAKRWERWRNEREPPTKTLSGT